MYSMPECGKGDHSLRVAAAAFGGSVQLIAADGTRMWHVARAGFEVHASPAIGHFGGIGAARGTPDVVFAMHKGVFPSYTSGLILWLDGTDGSVLHEHEGGHQIISSPVVIDINRDGIDDTIIVRDNEAMSSKTFFFADANSKASSSILIFDGMTGHVKIRRKIRGLAVATPALIALDVNYDGEGEREDIHTYIYIYYIYIIYYSIKKKNLRWTWIRCRHPINHDQRANKYYSR